MLPIHRALIKRCRVVSYQNHRITHGHAGPVHREIGPVVELVLGPVDLVLVPVLRAQQLLVHLVHVGDPHTQVVHLWLQRLKPVARDTPLEEGLKAVSLIHTHREIS